jgi:MoaA/NifB/PqqE/SkfB family radical SAM enzyme
MESRSIPFPVIDLYVTGQCNFRCPYCFGEDVSKGDIDKVTFARVVEFASHCKSSIGFTGGEPLLHEDFRGLVNVATSKKVPIILRTNGMLIDKYLDVIGMFEWVGISIDGASESVVKKMRPSAPKYKYVEADKWKKPIDNIRLINKHYPQVKVLLASLVSSFNSSSLLKLARDIQENDLAIDKWKLYQFTRNNFRSLTSSSKFETSSEFISEVCESLQKVYHGEIVNKVGDGNCLLVDTNGSVRVNDALIGNVFDDMILLEKKIRQLDMFNKISVNKIHTYNVE